MSSCWRSLEESLENLVGELESLAGRLTDNDARSAAAQAEIDRQEVRRRGRAGPGGGGALRPDRSCWRNPAPWPRRSAAERAIWLPWRPSGRPQSAAPRTCGRCARISLVTGSRRSRWRRPTAETSPHAEEEIAGLQTALEELAGRGAAFRQRLAAITEEKNALEAERTAKNRAGQEMNENLLNLERAVAKLEQKRATSAMEEKQILDRLWEHYELSHSDAQAQRIELESVPKANRRIGELKRDITALGTPNIGAIEEFERVNTRYTYLTDQRNDVEKAKGELQDIIERDHRGDDQDFRRAVQAAVNESFQTTFQELFGGGTARLELEDEEDILGCGIEIKAQPPGKTLKTISLLSGGEKAFVAIALYFSILKVHPTPFCVMDEIEAALDDANVTRYARYMRTLAGRTQFIVITHRRGTMEEADVLYGVTMQEQGVSKILTINLNDMAKGD